MEWNLTAERWGKEEIEVERQPPFEIDLRYDIEIQPVRYTGLQNSKV